MHESIQLSQDELLLILALLKLPPPLSLSTREAADYDAEGEPAALAGASGGLITRELLQPGATPADLPTPSPRVAELVSTVALAEATLIVASRRNGRHSLMHITLRPGSPVLHTSPRPRIHCLAALPGPEAVVNHVLSGLTAGNPSEQPLSFQLSGPVLDAALNAVGAGDPGAAVGHLRGDGVAEPIAAAFLRRAGPAPVRYALAALRDLREPQPVARSAVIIQGAAESWWGSPMGDGSDRLRLRGIDPATTRTNIAALVRWAME